jgi:predicted transcriptional regulator
VTEWYQNGIITGVAMTLRLSDDVSDALRRRAEAEQRSMQEVVRTAVREYIDRHDHADTVDGAAVWVVENFRDTLDRLGRA